MGLSIVYGIVKEHGGDIHVYSEAGKGTTFNIYMPISQEKEFIDTPDKPTVYETGTETILLVDDEAPIARMEEIMLNKLGYRVTACTSSREALTQFAAAPGNFDIVITDMSMPYMTGDELTKQIKSISPNTPVLICTGFSYKIDEEKAAAAGINGFLMKPVIKSELSAMIRKLLDAANQNRRRETNGR